MNDIRFSQQHRHATTSLFITRIALLGSKMLQLCCRSPHEEPSQHLYRNVRFTYRVSAVLFGMHGEYTLIELR